MAASAVCLSSTSHINFNPLPTTHEATEVELLADVRRTKAVYLAASDFYKAYARVDFENALDAFSGLIVHRRLLGE